MRPTLLTALLLLSVVPAAHAKPKPPPPQDGFAVCNAGGNQDAHTIASDGVGGFYVAWLDSRNAGSQDIYLQRVTGDLALAPGWPATGLPLTTLTYNDRPYVFEDGAGGALIVWRPNANEIRAQRVDGNATVHAGWPAGGKTITSGYFYPPFAVTSDGHGGAFIGWVRTVTGYTEIASLTRIDSDGTLVPPWTADGAYLWSDEQIRFLTLAPDPVDGVVYALGTYFNGIVDQVHARVGRVASDNASSMSSYLYYGQRNWNASAISDGQGGVFTAFTSQTLNPPSSGSWAQRLDPAGTRAWPESLAVPEGTILVGDGAGGTYLFSYEGTALVARRRIADGSLAPGWTPAGLALANTGNRGHTGALPTPTGFVACWAESAAGLDLRAVGVMSNGALAPGWPAGGIPVTQAAGDQSGFSMLPADSGEAFVVWLDDRQGPGNRDIYATRIGPTPPVGVEPVTPGVTIAFRSLAPNPARDVLRVELALAGSAPGSIVLVDAGGRIRLRREGVTSGNLVLPVGDLPAGIYWLSAAQGAQRATGRVVILH